MKKRRTAFLSLGSPRRTASIAVLLFVLTLFAGAARAQDESPPAVEPSRISVEWLTSDAGKRAAAFVSSAWLDDDTVVLYDLRLPEEERSLVAYDVVSSESRPLVDQEAVLARLSAFLEPEEPLEELGWPDAFADGGRHALYVREGDVFLLEIASSKLVRVTATEEEESAARFSPDGGKLAFSRSHDLYVYDIEAGSEKRLTHDGTETLLNATLSWVYWEEIFGREDLGYWWSPDSRSIAYLQTDESPVDVMTYVDFKPFLPRVIRQRYPKAGSANPKVRAGVVDLESGKTTWVDLGVYPYEYLVRVAWLPDGERLAVQTLDRQQERLDLFLAEAASGSVRHLLRETDEGWINVHDDLHFLAGGERFLWRSERDGHAHLYLYEMTGELVAQVTRGDWQLSAAPGRVFWLRQAVLHLDEENGWIYFVAHEKSSLEVHVYRIRLDGSGMERLSAEDGSHGAVFSPDGRRYLGTWSHVAKRPVLRLHGATGEPLRTIVEARDDMEPFELPTPELFTVPAADGFEMPAQMMKPADFDPAKKYPVIFYVYGGPSAPTVRNAWRPRYVDHVFTDAGYLVFRADNRSATTKSKKLENLILRDGYGKSELSDFLDAVAWLKSQPYVDPERVGMWGWSGGGTFTLQAMTSSQELKAGVAVASASDWRYYDTKWTEAFMKRPVDNPEGYEKTSNALRAKDLSGRLLLIHGTYDDNVNIQQAWRFVDELVEAGILFDMMFYPMRKHGIEDDAAQSHLYRTMLEFWRRNL